MIPKIIHKVLILNLEDPEYAIPAQIHEAVDTFRQMNPNHVLKLYRNIDCINFINTHCGENSRELKAYLNIKANSCKSDLMRKLFLFYEGGFYSDVKQVCLVPLPEINTPLFTHHPNKPCCDSLMASIPGHPFIKKIIDLTVDNYLSNYYGKSIYDVTAGHWLKLLPHYFTNWETFEYAEDSKYIQYKNQIFIKLKFDDAKPGQWNIPGSNSYLTLWRTKALYGETPQYNLKKIYSIKLRRG